MPDLLMPPPLKVINQWLRSRSAVTTICGTRIDWRLTSTFPAIRLADVGPIRRGPEEALHRIQVECWAADYDTAEELARVVVSELDTAQGEWPAGYCAGASVEAGPFASPDPNSQRFRHQLDLAAWLYPATS